MIIDLEHFIRTERPVWSEFETLLTRLESDSSRRMSLADLRRFHYLYQRVSADLAKITTFAAEPHTRLYLESLVAKAYGEIHEVRERSGRIAPLRWFFGVFPRTFRRHVAALWIVVAVTAAGSLFGGLAVALDPDAKGVLMPFAHVLGDPSERVQREETADEDKPAGAKAPFSTYLMTHNTRVSILAVALGMTWGIGTIVLLFYNGVILGAVVVDYVIAGESVFLAGWLLPHGSIEIPAILIAGQAGLVLASALLGRGRGEPVARRLRRVSSDVATLIAGVAILLVWAGLVEAFLSQYHEPVIPYWAKIVFGATELVLLCVFLTLSGRKPGGSSPPPEVDA